MFIIAPVLATELIVIYFVTTFVTITFCFVIGVSIYRSRKTPYPTRLLYIGLLCHDGLFLSCASMAKLFPHEDSFVLRHLSRGCQIAAQIIVGCMAFERLFVLNLSYVYLKTAKSFIR